MIRAWAAQCGARHLSVTVSAYGVNVNSQKPARYLPPIPHELPADKIAAIELLAARGMTVPKIAVTTQVSRASVRRLMAALGLPETGRPGA